MAAYISYREEDKKDLDLNVTTSGASNALALNDKAFIENLQERLSPSNMWVSSAGTIVDKKVEELANKCVVE